MARWRLVIILGSLLVLVLMWPFSPLAVLYVLTDGLIAGLVVLAAAGCGLWFCPFFEDRDRLPLRWHLMIGAGLGLGFLSLLILGLGCVGLLQRPLWIGILSAMGLLGLVRITQLRTTSWPEGAAKRTSPWLRAAPLALVPFLALALLVATVPPGVLWAEEAHGYDVQEYHLQVPKEFFLAGQITLLPHNVYSNFPSNVEMLYLLAMVIKGDPYRAAILAKLLNASLAVLFVCAAWLAGREVHPAAGLVSALLAGSAPWLMYLCGVAYVENGMLAFGMLAAACLCRSQRLARFSHQVSWRGSDVFGPARRATGARGGDLDRSSSPPVGGTEHNAVRPRRTDRSKPQQEAGEKCGLGAHRRLVVASGIFAGLSCGCKYTAIVLVALPLIVGLALVGAGVRRKVRDAVLCTIGILASFSPWLIKNVMLTGNPVFPLAYASFGAKPGVWSPELAERWQRAHRVERQDAPWRKRIARFKERVLYRMRTIQETKFAPGIGFLPFLLATPILISRTRSRLDLSLLAMAVVQIVVWLTLTHLFARFAVALLIPLCILGGRSLWAFGRRAYATGFGVAVGLTVVLNLSAAWSVYAAELTSGGESLQYHGHTEWFFKDNDADRNPAIFLRHGLGEHRRVLLIGETRAYYMPENVDYCVVFSPNPFAAAVAAASSDQEIIHWLREQCYTHVVVHWSEMNRLRSSYGFWDPIDTELFGRLEKAGLATVKEFRDQKGRVYATCYEVKSRKPKAEMKD